MQYAEKTDRSSHIPWIPGHDDQGLCRSSHQEAIESSLVGSHEAVKFSGQREDQMEVSHGEQLFSPFLEPPSGLSPVTLRTGSVATGVVGVLFVAAMVALVQVSSHHLCATIQEILDSTAMAGQHAVCKPIQIVRPMTAEDLGHFGHG
jgi:hypothetical protein